MYFINIINILKICLNFILCPDQTGQGRGTEKGEKARKGERDPGEASSKNDRTSQHLLCRSTAAGSQATREGQGRSREEEEATVTLQEARGKRWEERKLVLNIFQMEAGEAGGGSWQRVSIRPRETGMARASGGRKSGKKGEARAHLCEDGAHE